MSRMKLDMLCSSSDWAFVMSEADALESEDPDGCVAVALRRAARGRDQRRYGLVAAELMRRAAVRRAPSGAAGAAAGPTLRDTGARRPEEERRIPEDCETP